ncbi:acetyl-CoA carboxylase biotin carboxylase subunit [Micromonospora cathayae]|uniref:biotin carboxylase n=1 Tax=Micromonospora cathayae TaxID=3028804 RepID=A0ABY7ZH32_9ACTN|nr:acetyl-CoA carboxylase biotin carboxylase subunit [Micromonospora sp. HUAS 3]WDZ82170.1 acetyl-CoA carboxylase biotin carboxylase subunit [Micromonospora sp. HUAS 3]
MFAKVLIANRGEIALRVARTCRELGIRTVAVYSTVDADSAVVRFADEAVCIGPPAVKRSYLNIPAVIEAALSTGADAIHPGYGFLSEDPDFAEVCEKNGITFIGPPGDLMGPLGDKAEARAIMARAGLPVLPGSDALATLGEAREAAERVGFPLIIKPVVGGGGRGMAVVDNPEDFTLAYQQARANAQAVFGDGRVYLERYVEAARHIEVQVLCDTYGNGVHLGERNCSVQRRHQKLLEESPALGLPVELTEQMCELSAQAARSIGYVGAGTLEFLVDSGGEFYFMEINSRIQVEHPVTEMVTGIDLVREQIRVAAGEPLRITQRDVQRRGVSIECRINAEDPARGFVPTPGPLHTLVLPGGPFTRVDTHGYQGWSVGPDYDSLLAKVVVWAPDRDQAVARMSRALHETLVEGPGVRTTGPFLQEVLAHPRFLDAKYSVLLVEQMLARTESA